MKAEELMIGDWVKVTDWYEGEKFSEVERVYPYSIETTYDERVEEEDIYPIPITQEILEKNGFVGHIHVMDGDEYIDYWKYEFQSKDRDEGVMDWIAIEKIETEDAGTIWYLKARLLSHPYITMWIDHVHELQHVLRLCKIDKEIIP